ncbi:SusC/RagA family TonB-linked outer membrane protein [Sphingobacterium faecium]|uniref:SusC/RagA family TonB-linked outer membrane protein n=1 Tax=Sphingobacterium faecium TaxID=34087 RepID=UPI002468756B|nr:TonB-dependent receptor [Sphingobacterium faecium]MDH5825280.1 TonB-dependent receptor [Sphingobacterium faecium]
MKRKATILSFALSLVMSATFAQKIKVKGSVTDDRGNVLSGVTVTEKGTGNATATNTTGVFELNAETGKTLIFNIVGYDPKEVVYTGGNLNISLTSSNTALDEVVVVAFGTQKKTNLTGSVASITPKQLADRPVTSLQNALQGISPGITVLSRPGEVAKGGGATITVRGRSNLGSPSPMFIIDGIPATSTEFSAINPNDISSMSVLKDAASSSLYGSRAANGVILVTTKKGGGDRPVVGFSANYALQSATYLPNYANSVEYTTLYNRAMRNAGKNETFTAEQIELYKNGSQPDLYPNTDWYKEVLDETAPQKDFSVNITAPGKTTKYYMGLNYFDQNSLVPGRSQKRINAKLNTETEIVKDLLKIGSNFSFLKQDYDRDGSGISWWEMGRSLPITVLKHSDGTWGSISNGQPNSTIANNNQLRAITEGGRGNNRDNYLQAALNGSLTPLKGLSIDGLISLKYTNTNSFSFTNRTDPIINFITKKPMDKSFNAINEMTEYWGKRQELLLQGTINYERTFGDHYGKATVGASQESNIYREAFLGRKNFLNNNSNTIVNGSSDPADMSSDDKGLANRTMQDEWAIRSFFGRFNYAYKDKYLFEANARIDYSSRFASELREAVFPSFSAGWNINKEDFLQDVSWIDQLKLRGSYGSLGNQDVVVIGNYYNTLKISSIYNFEGNAVDGAQQARAINVAALWEKVYMSNVGVDATLFGGKVNFTAEYFVKNTKDILLQPITLATSGWDKQAYANQGQTRNRGIEVIATYNGKVGDEFKYSVSGNFSYIKNKIVSLGNFNESIDGYWINRINGSVGDYYGYKSDGLFTSQAEIDNHPSQKAIAGNSKIGDIKYVDVNGDGELTPADRAVLGNDVPWINYGFNLRASYKNFDIDVLTYGVAGVKTYMEGEAVQPFFNNGNIKSQWLENGWTEENNIANADFPRITLVGDAPQNYITSDFWLFSGNYLRIRAITLGYTFPSESINRVGFSQLRVFGSSNNPFTIVGDKRLGDYDPETGSGRPGFPGVKTFSLGITAKF